MFAIRLVTQIVDSSMASPCWSHSICDGFSCLLASLKIAKEMKEYIFEKWVWLSGIHHVPGGSWFEWVIKFLYRWSWKGRAQKNWEPSSYTIFNPVMTLTSKNVLIFPKCIFKASVFKWFGDIIWHPSQIVHIVLHETYFWISPLFWLIWSFVTI